MVKKIVKKTSKKVAKKKIELHAENVHFLGILVLFVGFSAYAIVSFFMSTDMYVDRMYASTVGGVADVEEVVVDEPYAIFSDVYSDAVGSFEIENLKNLGVVGGYPDGSFKPENFVNRAEFLKLIVDAVDGDLAAAVYANCFTDVKEEWFAPFVCYAKDNKWIGGFEDGSFQFDRKVNMAEGLKIALLAFEFNVPEAVIYSPMDGVEVDVWFAPYVQVAVDYSLFGNGLEFDATKDLTRVDVVMMLSRVMKAKGMM